MIASTTRMIPLLALLLASSTFAEQLRGNRRNLVGRGGNPDLDLVGPGTNPDLLDRISGLIFGNINETPSPTPSPTVGPEPAPTTYTHKYVGKWPHCENIGECICTNDIQLLEETCTKSQECSGFSYSNAYDPNIDTHGKCGCLKACGDDEAAGGYGTTGSHDYYEKVLPQN